MFRCHGLIVSCLLVVGGAAQGAAGAAAEPGPTEILGDLLGKKDDADPKVIEHVGNLGTREAAEGLIKLYDAAHTLYVRLAVIKALGGFQRVAEAMQPALTKLAEIAGGAAEVELRQAAIKGLGQSDAFGHALLRKIIDSDVDDSVREMALREHVKQATADDAAWYRFLWNPKAEQRKDAMGNIAGPELNAVRELAFSGLVDHLSEDELVETLRRDTEDPKIRRVALRSMRDRNMGKTSEMAQWLLERVDYPGTDRAEAARLLIDRDGAKAVGTFLELSRKRDATPDDLRETMARLIAKLDDEATNKRVAKLVGKGKPHEQVFALLAAAKTKDPKVMAAIRKELVDKAPEVRRAAATVVAERGDREALPDLRAMLAKPRYTGDQRLAIETIGVFERGGNKWLEELMSFASSPERETRNAALDQLVEARSRKFLPTLLTALDHEDWSTRLIAIDGLARLRDKEAVPHLIDRLDKDKGRLGRRIVEALWSLTAQPFEDDVARWHAWWTEAAEKFEVVTQEQLERATKARELKRLQARTVSTPTFFGIKVESHRVIFIIDTSGSMLETLYGHYVGKRGAARIDVAKQELSQAIKNLEPGALFNVFSFSTGFDRWQKEGVGVSTQQNRDAALTWVDRLGAAGATNLYDTVEAAFADKDVDTIFILSDGEPTSGAVIDAHRIREDVAFWNKYRRVKINTIAIGGNLEVLEWLAKDAEGTYTQIR